MVKKNLCGLTADEIFNLIEPLGFSYYHAVSITNCIYKKGTGEISHIKNIPGKLKDYLEANTCSGIIKPVASDISTDKTAKFVFRFDTGKKIETVFIPDSKRKTVCVSTQAGCRMGCSYCATGRHGFNGNLQAGEIVNQILGIPVGGKVTHVVFMGMGEPMDNLENVLKACEIITAEWGLAVSPRNVTVSTAGILPGIEKFLEFSKCNLTLSLFSPFSEERQRAVPLERQYPVKLIIEKMKAYQIEKKRRLSIAYIMIKDVNDSDLHLKELIYLLSGSIIRVNLVPYHTLTDDANVSSSVEKMQYFKHNLVVSGISASIRKSRGADISAACGLLAPG